jgi:hypothetical protein
MTDSSRLAAHHPRTSLYMRADKMHLRSDRLTSVTMMDGDRKMQSAKDPNTLLCIQCHAPNYIHEAGTEDDRTPVGIHEGISCTVCHKPHSGKVRESCIQCHSVLTQDEINAVFAHPHGIAKHQVRNVK